jgi:hypothetical protein
MVSSIRELVIEIVRPRLGLIIKSLLVHWDRGDRGDRGTVHDGELYIWVRG